MNGPGTRGLLAPPRPPWRQVRPLVSDDGVPLRATHLPGADGSLAVVLAHGFTGSTADPGLRRVAAWLRAEGPGVLGVDQRGHGASGGRTTVGDAEVRDLRAAVRWARVLGYRRVATVGFSMGGAVALRHAALDDGRDGPLSGVVSVSAPGRWYYRGTPAMRRAHLAIERPVGRVVTRVLRGTRIVSRGWDPVPLAPQDACRRIGDRGVPLLVVHGDQDHYFPVEHARGLARAGSATLWVEPGFGHAENAVPEDLVRRIARWLLAVGDGEDAQ